MTEDEKTKTLAKAKELAMLCLNKLNRIQDDLEGVKLGLATLGALACSNLESAPTQEAKPAPDSN